MKLLIILWVLWSGLASAAEPQRNPGRPPASAEKRVALVIGNAAYPGAGALNNPANDAIDIATKLKKLGFDVIVRTDMRQKEMLRSLTEFGDKVQSGTEALFFYAGHGMQVRGRNYLIPIDAEIRSEASVSSEAVDVDQLLDKLAPARLSMVILDACRNNPFERRFRGGGQGLAQINAPTGTLIAYATAPGQVASDGEGRNGLYTSELLSAMDVPGIRIEDVFKRVRANVVKKSGEAQTPWESSSLTGDFYFIQGSVNITMNQPAYPAPTRLKADAEIEQELWDSIKDADSAETLDEYIKAYPNGRFVAQARVLIVKAKKAAGIPATAASSPPASSAARYPDTAEDAVWASVEKGNSADDYDAYLTQYPQGKFAVLAKNRKARLAQESQVARQGRRILGQWSDGRWYPATVTGQNGNQFSVAFDDGDKADLPAARIRAIDWAVGTRVQCNWKSGGRYYAGTITTNSGLAVHISYDDGDQEDTTISKCRSQ